MLIMVIIMDMTGRQSRKLVEAPNKVIYFFRFIGPTGRGLEKQATTLRILILFPFKTWNRE